ncbi:MAG: hypothetical protein JKY24_03605, partial [Pseudomonadales bacterium]|nr:hypothetical protein [Pseudomonadales bacterium]
ASNSLNSDLVNEIQKTILSESITTTFNDLSTSYGTSSPTDATTKGGWTTEGDVSQPGSIASSTKNLAKNITNKTANRISRQVALTRENSRINGQESLEEHIHNNVEGNTNRVAVYRWVDKVYSAYTTDYGNRLMIEFMVDQPANPYIANTLNLQGIDLTPPPTLQSVGVNSYRDINRNNYPDLLTTYNIDNCEQYTPKPAYRISSTAFHSMDGPYSKDIPIEAGYQATHASVTYAISNVNQKLMGVIGSNAFTIPESDHAPIYSSGNEIGGWVCTPSYFSVDDVQTGTVCLNLNNETLQLCASINSVDVVTSPPPPDNANSHNYSVTIEVYSALEKTIAEQWQMAVYNALEKSYAKMNDVYFQHAKGPVTPLGHENSEDNRIVERCYLKQAGMRLLMAQRRELVGQACNITSPPDQYEVNAPRFEQFADHMFEWDEMTYRFYPHIHNDGTDELPINCCTGTDSLFTSFLKSTRARLLVPVKPEHAQQVLYFLSTGTIWEANPLFAPSLESNKDIFNELITLSLHGDNVKGCTPDAWEFVIPSSMTVIQSDCQQTFAAFPESSSNVLNQGD